MPVLGVGLDLVDVEGWARQLADPASAFLEETFHEAERSAAPTDATRRLWYFAARFAAKEAFVKAWSGARRGHPPALARVDLRDIEVVADSFGRPALRVHGPVRAALDELGAGCGSEIVVHLSLTHDGPTAGAVVVIETREPADGDPGPA